MQPSPSQPRTEPILRPATAEDLPTVLELLALLDAAGDPPLDLESARAVFARMSSYPSYTVWLVELEGRVVATYSLCILDNLGHRGAGEGIVENVAVRPELRGRGIGATMMRHAMDRCREAGCYKLVLSSNLAREDAHRFYDSLGFSRHGISFRVEL